MSFIARSTVSGDGSGQPSSLAGANSAFFSAANSLQTISHTVFPVMPRGTLPFGECNLRRMRFTRSFCSPRRGSGVSGADAGAGVVDVVDVVDVVGADEAGEGGGGGDGDVVDVSGVDASGGDVGDVDDGVGGAAGGSCSPWNDCWNRRAISAKASFISGGTILARASFIPGGEVTPGSFCCTHSRKLVGLSPGFAMDFELGGEV